MADKKKRAPVPPGNNVPVRELSNPAYVDVDGSQQGKKMSLPLPDYDTLFPQKRHGVQGHTRWDHIIAEVNQRHRDLPPEFLGPEMSVDGPEDHKPIVRSSLEQESPAMRHYQPQPPETKPVSSKKVAAPLPPKSVAPPPPKSVAPPPPLPRSGSVSSQRQSQNITHQSALRPSPSAAAGPAITDASSRESLPVRSMEGTRKVLHPSPAARPTSPADWDTPTPDDQRNVQVTVNKEAPTAKPRQRVNGKEPVQQEDSAVTPVQTLSSSNMSSLDKKDSWTKENFVEFDPFPSTDLLSKDSWAQPKQNKEKDDFFMGSAQKEQKLEDRGITPDDLDDIFGREKLTDPFASFNGSDSNKQDEDSPAFQRRNSRRRNQIPPSTTHPDIKTLKSQQEPAYKEETTITTPNQGLSARAVMNESVAPKPQAEAKTPSRLYGAVPDLFGAEPFTVTSEPLQVVMEESETQAGGLSGGKMPLRAWVSPSEVQPVSAQNSNGGGLALSARRPHPVKPMSSVENQHPISSPAVKEIKVRDSTTGKIQVPDSVETGPYTQLTQEELITLVVKQQTDLSRKDAKIVELEEYIDNLLVRVIDEKPSILQSLNAKPV